MRVSLLVIWVSPVSYTHLDVYKRQVLPVVLVFMVCEPTEMAPEGAAPEPSVPVITMLPSGRVVVPK